MFSIQFRHNAHIIGNNSDNSAVLAGSVECHHGCVSRSVLLSTLMVLSSAPRKKHNLGFRSYYES